jgi:hypothetical protein
MNDFDINGYKIVPNVISKETASLLATEFNLMRDNYLIDNNQQLSIGSIVYAPDGLVDNFLVFSNLF